MDLISPREFVRISHVEWTRDFAQCIDAINAGTIFLVYGNKYLEEIYQRSIRPRYQANDRKYFGPNPDDMYKKQDIQRALFSDLVAEADIFADSYVRLRRTIGQGAFVGPHIDFYEDLPKDGVNCWVSFSSLEASEAIQFLPADYHPGGDMSGHFKPGVRLDMANKLMPSSKLVRDAMSHAINPCEYFVFNSGRTVHCSPFYVRTDRVTCDQRVFLMRDPKDANFGELLNYYSLTDQAKFDGAKEVQSVLSELWSVYQKKFDFPICQFRAGLRGGGDMVLDIARQTRMDPSLFLREKHDRELSLGHSLVQEWLTSRPRSVALRMRLLDHVRCPVYVNTLCSDLLRLTPENPEKIYRRVFAHPCFNFQSLSNLGDAGAQSTIVESMGRLLRLMNLSIGRYAPGALRSRLNRKIAFALLKNLHPEIVAQTV